jgi:hypothetical protein
MTTLKLIDQWDEVIDSRDIIERLEFLEGVRDQLTGLVKENYEALHSLKQKLKNKYGWYEGLQLIRGDALTELDKSFYSEVDFAGVKYFYIE